MKRVLVREKYPALVGGSRCLRVRQELSVGCAMQVEEHGVGCIQFVAVVCQAAVGHRAILERVPSVTESVIRLQTRAEGNHEYICNYLWQNKIISETLCAVTDWPTPRLRLKYLRFIRHNKKTSNFCLCALRYIVEYKCM